MLDEGEAPPAAAAGAIPAEGAAGEELPELDVPAGAEAPPAEAAPAAPAAAGTADGSTGMADVGAGTAFLGCEVRAAGGAGGAAGTLRGGAEPEAARGILGAARENAALIDGREGLARLASNVPAGASITGCAAGFAEGAAGT